MLRINTAPVVDRSPCDGVSCANSAKCVVNVASDGSRSPSCVCRTCNGSPTRAVCGTDLKSYPSTCELKRTACMESRNIQVLRNFACGKFISAVERNKSSGEMTSNSKVFFAVHHGFMRMSLTNAFIA